MKTIAKRSAINTIRGSLLRLGGGRAIAIYLRKGVVSVADFTGGPCRIFGVAEWHCFNGRKLAHAQRRGEVKIAAIPDDVADRIERQHRRMEWLVDPVDRVTPGAASRAFFAGFPMLSRLLFAFSSR